MKAIIIIDVQEAYVGHRRGEARYQEVLANINAVAALFRQAHCPVFVVRDLSEGNDDCFANVRELVVEPSDIEILKVYNNSFWKTDLDALLRSKGVDWVLLCGNAAEFCVTATYFGALEHGYATHLLKDGVLAETEEGLISMERVRPLLAVKEIAPLLAE
jgi:nicotinamidase-related amidase